MAHKNEKKQSLRALYIFDKLSLEKACEQVGISHPTARRWKAKAQQEGDNWDKLRAAHTLAGNDLEDVARSLLTDLVLQFKSTMDLLALDESLTAKDRVGLLTSLSDSYNKAISANKKLLPETSKFAVALQVIELLAEFIAKEKPELQIEFMGLLNRFGSVLEKELKT